MAHRGVGFPEEASRSPCISKSSNTGTCACVCTHTHTPNTHSAQSWEQRFRLWNWRPEAEGSEVRGLGRGPQPSALGSAPPHHSCEQGMGGPRPGKRKAAGRRTPCLSQAPCSHPSGAVCDEGPGLTNHWAPVPLSPLYEPASQSPLGLQQYILFTKRIAWPPRDL